VVTGAEHYCCAEPMPAVRELDVGARGTHLELRSCSLDPCDCACPDGGCEPERFEAWYPLGELASGEHVVTAGEHTVRVRVP